MTHRDGLPRFYGRFGASVNVDISRSTGAKSSVRTGTSAGASRASWCSTVNPGAGAGISSPGCPLPWPYSAASHPRSRKGSSLDPHDF